jgi:dipeptidyl aminopeptidase/acylaminoacyl peptidase
VLLAVTSLAGGAGSPAHAGVCPVPRIAADESPRVSREGSFLLFTRREGGCPLRRSVWLADLRGRQLRRLAKPAFGVGASWRADGLINISRPTGSTLLGTDGSVHGHVPIQFPFWAPDSEHAAYGDHTQIRFWPGETLVPGRDNYIGSMQPWSPTGDRLSYIHVGVPTSQVVVARADGSGATALYTARFVDGPTWSPDGQWVAFAAGETALHLYVARADSTDDLLELMPAFARIGHSSWSPDGRWIAFAARRAGRDGLYAVHPDGTGLHRIASRLARPEEDPSWYPQATGVAYEGWTRACRRLGIFFVRADGRGSVRLTNRCR